MKKISNVKKLSKKDLKEIGETKELVEEMLTDSKDITKYRKKLYNYLYGDKTKVYGLNKSTKKNANNTIAFFESKIDEACSNYKKNKSDENKKACMIWLGNYESYLNSSLNKALNKKDSEQTL